MENNPIVFLTAPASLKDKAGSFKFDPSILLPVEKEKGEKDPDPENITLEMILSGMLKVISASVTAAPLMPKIPPEWIEYYRNFVFAVKPGIYHEFTSAAIVKAANEEFGMALEINAVLEGLFPRSPGVLLSKALILEKKAAIMEKNGRGAERENAQALEAYETALAAEPVLPDALFNAGYFFMRRRDFVRAKDCFAGYVSVSDEPVKKKEAENIIRNIGGQGLDDENYREAYDCISRGDDKTGLLKIRKFIEKYPRVRNGWFILGWALRKLGRFSDGLEAFKKAGELGNDPGGTSGDIRNEMAICLMELGDLRGARKELEHALREEPENIKIISNLGVLAQKCGKTDEAAAFFRTVLELDPGDPLANHFFSGKIP